MRAAEAETVDWVASSQWLGLVVAFCIGRTRRTHMHYILCTCQQKTRKKKAVTVVFGRMAINSSDASSRVVEEEEEGAGEERGEGKERGEGEEREGDA